MEVLSLDLAAPLLVPDTCRRRPSPHIPRVTLTLLFTAATVFWLTSRSAAIPPHAAVKALVDALAKEPLATTRLAADERYWYGVSLGGWLVMEINPSHRGPGSSPDLRPNWMFDAIEATSELGFVTALREVSDEFAVRTMRNHWAGYIPDAALDAAAALGVNAVRVPVGYWIMDAPVGGSSPLEYGFSPEGFVTGGLNHLRALLRKLAARRISALIDVHALPCNSACVSDGIDCAAPLAFSDVAPVGDIARCGGGTYHTSRAAEAGGWRAVAVGSVGALAAWLAALPAEEAAVVAALQLANEPALNSPGHDAAVKDFYRVAVGAARASLQSLQLVLSFIPPNDAAVPAFVEALRAAGSGRLIIDHRAPPALDGSQPSESHPVAATCCL